eukprot:GILI01022894.1.p1 GENE.GILI01022894.1~~GILI01022894.1.p1  ORF type:complete len:319 (-),score=68.34 GILI01022894.1:215-1171(-)
MSDNIRDELTVLEVENGSLHPSLKDFIAGTFAGMAITVVGHPFDTLKVRLQTQTTANAQFKGAVDCLLQTVKKEGIRGLYKGMGSPFATVPIVNAVVFAAYGQAKLVVSGGQETSDEQLSVTQLVAAGAWAGFVNSVVVGPVELVKARLQVQYDNPKNSLYKGPVDCVLKIIKTDGIKGIFRGMSSTIYREVPAYAAQFGAYETVRRAMARSQNKEVKDLGPGWTLLAGGIGGISCWIFSYPQDLVKTRLQVQADPLKYPAHKFLMDGGFFSCWKDVVKTDGYMGLWRGFGPCIARAFPANATGFLAYETCMKVLNSM